METQTITQQSQTSRIVFINYEKAKNQIITDIATSVEFKNKVRHIAFKNSVTDKSGLLEDVIQEVLLQLLKMDGEKMFNEYAKNPNYILGIALVIAKRAFMSNVKNPDYPKHSFIKSVKHTSTYNSFIEVNHTDAYEGESWTENPNSIVLDETDMYDNLFEEDKPTAIQMICEYLEEDEVDYLNDFMNNLASSGYVSVKERAYREVLFAKIKDIAELHNINVGSINPKNNFKSEDEIDNDLYY